jgi:tetratricopeptide (TPR) repeat protein
MRYLAKVDTENAKDWLLKAIAESPGRRESLVEMAGWGYQHKQWAICLQYADMALKITDKPLDYLCEEFAWGFLPYDLAALGYYYLGDKTKAEEYGKKALELDPTNERLERNLEWYKSE